MIQAAGTTPWMPAYWNPNSVCALLVEIFGQPSVPAFRHQYRLVPCFASLPQESNNGRRKIAVPENRVDMVSVISMEPFNAVDIIKGLINKPF